MARNTAQQVKLLAAKSDDLSSILGLVVEGRNQFLKVVLWFP